MKLQKVKAGALQLALFIMVVITLLLASFVIFSHVHKRFNMQTSLVLETIDLANKGVKLSMKDNVIQTQDTLKVPLNNEEGYKSLYVHKSSWGVFEKIISKAKVKNNFVQKVALVGGLQSQNERIALYVQDNNRPLVVVGNTKIQGLSYVPKQGVRTGNIAGHSYYGNQLIYGATKISQTELPKPNFISNQLVNDIQHKMNSLSQNQFLDISKKNVYSNSFLKPLKVIYSKGVVNLSGKTLTGHILVQSEDRIIVDASSNLKDVILFSPEIEIKSNTKGYFQAIATKELIVGQNCDLEFPSALIMLEDKTAQNIEEASNDSNTANLVINESTKIKGVVIYSGTTKKNHPQLFIAKNTTICGEVYCNRNLELLGEVKGSVYTSSFVASQSGSSYQNHLYNADISINKLPQEYVGLLFKDTSKEVVKWLY